MKKSFYKLYLEKQTGKNEHNIIEKDLPKIRSPNKIGIAITYCFTQIIKLLIIMVIIILSTIGTIVLTNEYLKNEFIELLFSSFLLF